MRHPRIVGLLALAGAAVGLTAFAAAIAPSDAPREEGPGSAPLRVVAAPIARDDGYVVEREFIGRVEARQRAALGFEIGGEVVEVTFDEGDVVPAGAVVARLDRDRLDASRRELVAARDAAAASLDLADLRRARFDRALALDAVSQQERDDADTAWRVARAELVRAEAAVATLDATLDETVVTSPFDAFVARRAVDVGTVVAAGSTVVELLERGAPEVRVSIGGAAVDALDVGDRIDVDVRGRTLDARVVSLLPTRDRRTRGVDVRAELDVALGDVRDGDIARVVVRRRIDADGFGVPLTALTQDRRGLWALYVVGDDARVTAQPVEVLHSDERSAFVQGALPDGALVVLDGLHRIAPGTRVDATQSEAAR